jgi:predicted ribosome-associated RNA-binding protein Tma20
MKQFIIIFLLSFVQYGTSQVTISGKVVDINNQPIQGANVYLDGTYDGDTTNDNGDFLFLTEEEGKQVLIVSFLSFETKTIYEDVSKLSNLQIKLREDVGVAGCCCT